MQHVIFGFVEAIQLQGERCQMTWEDDRSRLIEQADRQYRRMRRHVETLGQHYDRLVDQIEKNQHSTAHTITSRFIDSTKPQVKIKIEAEIESVNQNGIQVEEEIIKERPATHLLAREVDKRRMNEAALVDEQVRRERSTTIYPPSSSSSSSSITTREIGQKRKEIPSATTTTTTTTTNTNITSSSSAHTKPPKASNRLISEHEPHRAPYIETVRNRAEREALPGHMCIECSRYYEALAQQVS